MFSQYFLNIYHNVADSYEYDQLLMTREKNKILWCITKVKVKGQCHVSDCMLRVWFISPELLDKLGWNFMCTCIINRLWHISHFGLISILNWICIHIINKRFVMCKNVASIIKVKIIYLHIWQVNKILMQLFKHSCL